jgi:basic amino acid/polyamine antiporter, APA family
MLNQRTEGLTQFAGDAQTHGLRRALGVWGATAFVVSNMVGTGIFTVPAFVRMATGTGYSALGVWAVGAFLALCGALCYAELATRMPEAGGEYYYLHRICGRLWGFLSGWISFVVGFSAAIAAAALAAVAYASDLFPSWHLSQPLIEGWGLTRGSTLAGVLVLALAIFHSTGVSPSGRLQTLLAGMVIISTLVFVIAGVSSGSGNWDYVVQPHAPTGLWWIALIQVSFAYSGWNAATYLAGEVMDPGRTLPRALVMGTVIVAVLYLALNLLFLYAIPPDGWTTTIAVGSIAANRLFGPEGAQVVSLVIMIAIIASISAMTAAGPRIYFAMAKDGLAPSHMGRLRRSSQAPATAILIQAAAAVALALTGAFESLLLYVGSALLLLAGLTAATLFLLPRRADNSTARFFSTPGYPITPAIVVILMVVAWFQGFRERPLPTGLAFVTVLAGAGIFYFSRARGWLGPASSAEKTRERRKAL